MKSDNLTIQKEGSQNISLVAAPFTPMDARGEVRLEMIEPYAEKLLNDGVSAVFVGGTTGEGMSLTIAERTKIAEHWKSALGGQMKLIVHVGHASVREAEVLARHAKEIAADAIASIGPTFFTPANPHALVSYCRTIAASAPELPFYYYHMPSMSRVPFAASSLFVELNEVIPSFRGIKFTHEDLTDYKRCLEMAANNREIFFGRDELLLEGIRAGAKSAVGSTYNFATPLYHQMAQAWFRGDRKKAESLQKLCTQAIQVMVKFGGLVGIKYTMSFFGIDCGAPRLPLATLSKNEIKTMHSQLEEIGFIDALLQSKPKLEIPTPNAAALS